VLYHYVRVKIFTDRGREQQGTVDIPHLRPDGHRRRGWEDHQGDGTVVELRKDAVFERDIVRTGGLKVKALSFAMPAVEPGAIVEYRYKEIVPELPFTPACSSNCRYRPTWCGT